MTVVMVVLSPQPERGQTNSCFDRPRGGTSGSQSRGGAREMLGAFLSFGDGTNCPRISGRPRFLLLVGAVTGNGLSAAPRTALHVAARDVELTLRHRTVVTRSLVRTPVIVL